MNSIKQVFEGLRFDAKCIHNIHVALDAFKRLLVDWDAIDDIYKSALFSNAVLNYAKPFTETKVSRTQSGKKYKISKIKTNEFNNKIHEHLLSLRQKMIAHEDFSEVSPHFGIGNIRVDGLDFDIPVEMGVTSGSILFPDQKVDAERFFDHCKSLFDCMVRKIDMDFDDAKILINENPGKLDEIMEEEEILSTFTTDGGHGAFVNLGLDDWGFMEVSHSDFSSLLSGGYVLRKSSIGKKFFNQKVVMPNGEIAMISDGVEKHKMGKVA